MPGSASKPDNSSLRFFRRILSEKEKADPSAVNARKAIEQSRANQFLQAYRVSATLPIKTVVEISISFLEEKFASEG